jgi:hypothetical protein
VKCGGAIRSGAVAVFEVLEQGVGHISSDPM